MNLTNQSNYQNKDEYIIERALPEEYSTIIHLMQKTFYLEEPACAELKLTSDSPDFDALILNKIQQGYTIVAKTQSDKKIVACLINECVYPDSSEETKKLLENSDHYEFKYVIKFYDCIQRHSKVFNRFLVDSVFEFGYLAVSNDHRRKGLSERLMMESITIAKNAGFKVIQCQATNFYTSKACEKIGLKQIGQMRFDVFRDENNTPIITPPPQHDVVRMYVKRI